MEIKRDIHLNRIIARKHNGMIKVITGLRRCGKSYLLFNLFQKHQAYAGAGNHICCSTFFKNTCMKTVLTMAI